MSGERIPTVLAARKEEIGDYWDDIAEKWDAWSPIVDAWFAPVTAALLASLQLKPGDRVLELAAGSGALTIHLARAVGPEGRVLATDVGPNMVKLAARNIRTAGLSNVMTRVMDGETPDVAWASMDAVACRQGVMFFADPASALVRLLRVLRPGGRLGVTVFTTPERNGFILTPNSILRRWSEPEKIPPSDETPGGPGAFSLGKPGLLASLFQRAGFGEVFSQVISVPLRLPSLDDLLRFDREILGDPVADKSPEVQQKAWREVADASRQYVGEGSGGAPAEFLVVSGRRPLT
jgi:ubiquinone/menaquinone biosynthesis C-methylase UbiE